MATYTMELRKVCEYYGRDTVESWFKSYEISHYLTPEQIEQIEKFGVWSKERLAKKIVDWYFMREIGFETPALFEHYAKITMERIMESKLPKIYSSFLEYDPLSSVDYVEEYTREIEGTSNTNGSSSSSSRSNGSGLNINNDTPETNISKQDIETGIYASSVNQSETTAEINDNTTTNAEGRSNTIERYTHSMKGDNGVIVTNQYLVREYREIISAVDSEIIDELDYLFMGLY